MIINFKGMMVVKTCFHCSNSLDDDALFCSSCGISMENPSPEASDVFYCPNCGEQVKAEETRFCPKCGESFGAIGQARQGMQSLSLPFQSGLSPRMIGGIAIAGAAVLVLMIGGFLLGSVFSSPASKFVSYQKDFAQSRVLPVLEDAAEQFNSMGNFSTDMTLTAATNGYDQYGISDYLDGSELNLQLETTKRSVLANFDAKLMGSQVLTGAASYQEGTFQFFFPELADACYKVDLSKLEKQLGDDASGLHEIEIPEISVKLLSALTENYVDVLLQTANKKNVTVSEEKSFHLMELGEEVTGKVYVFKPSQEDLNEMLVKLADQIEKDQKMRKLVSDFVGSNWGLLQSSYETGEDFDVILDRELTNIANDIRDNANELSQTLEAAGFCWSMGVSDKRICMQRIEWDGGNQVLGYESFGKKNNRHERYYCHAYGESVMLDYQKDQKDDSYHGEFSFYDGGDQSFALKFEDVTTKTKSVLGLPYGTFCLQQNSGDSETWFSCELEVLKGESGGSDHILRLNGLTSLSDVFPNQMDLTLHTTDKNSTAKKPAGKITDISDYDGSQIESLVYDMYERFQNEVVKNLP